MKTNAKNIETKVTSEKSILDAKNATIEKRKEQIKNSQNSIFDNVDFMNLEKKVSSIKVKESITKEAQKMYKFELSKLDAKQQKRERTKLRNKRNKFANNVILHFQKKNESELRKEIDLFKEFYKANYILNDYSLISLSSNNRDEDTKILLNSFLDIVKLIMTIK